MQLFKLFIIHLLSSALSSFTSTVESFQLIPTKHKVINDTSFFPTMSYIAVLSVCAPQIRTGSCTEVGVVTFRFMDPPPAQILLEVDVERA